MNEFRRTIAPGAKRCGARRHNGGEPCQRLAFSTTGRWEFPWGACTRAIVVHGFSAQARLAQRLKWRGPRRIKGRRKWEPIEISRVRVAVNKELEVAAEQGALFDSLRLQSLKMIKRVLDLPNDLEHFGG